jgi:hypothetical protein
MAEDILTTTGIARQGAIRLPSAEGGQHRYPVERRKPGRRVRHRAHRYFLKAEDFKADLVPIRVCADDAGLIGIEVAVPGNLDRLG